MPVSADIYAFIDGNRRIVGVVLVSKISQAQAASAANGYATITPAQATTAGVDADADINDLVGRHVDTSGAVTTYTSPAGELRTINRGVINGLIRVGLSAIPPVAAGKDDLANGLIHKYLRACYAASQVDANMDDATRFNWVEDAAKGGSLEGGIRAFFKSLAIADPASSLVTGWQTALGDTITTLVTVSTLGQNLATTATLPSEWATSRSYEPANAL